jgi:hypothetical protein
MEGLRDSSKLYHTMTITERHVQSHISSGVYKYMNNVMWSEEGCTCKGTRVGVCVCVLSPAWTYANDDGTPLNIMSRKNHTSADLKKKDDAMPTFEHIVLILKFLCLMFWLYRLHIKWKRRHWEVRICIIHGFTSTSSKQINTQSVWNSICGLYSETV